MLEKWNVGILEKLCRRERTKRARRSDGFLHFDSRRILSPSVNIAAIKRIPIVLQLKSFPIKNIGTSSFFRKEILKINLSKNE